MNEKDLFSAIGGAEEEDLARSRRSPSHSWRKWAVAACLCLAIGLGAAVVLPQFGLGTATISGIDGMTGGSPAEGESNGNTTGNSESYEATEQSDATGETDGSDDAGSTQENPPTDGVTIPAITLPETTDSDIVVDMTGTLVYQGRVYSESQTFYGEDTETARALLGEKLGTASGTLNEWSTQDDYATEFASTYTGEVYTVEGYDASFRLAVVEETESGPFLVFLENLNGITLSVGSDLFEDRLHLSENLASVTYQTWEDWNSGVDKETPLTDCTDEEWAAFLTALNEASFVDMYADNPAVYSSGGQTFLNCTLSDGTTVQLRLIEGGYVGYQPLRWYFVKLSEEVFDPIYQAARGSSYDYY